MNKDQILFFENTDKTNKNTVKIDQRKIIQKTEIDNIKIKQGT